MTPVIGETSPRPGETEERAAIRRLPRFLPALFIPAIIAADQATKAWIVANISLDTIGRRYLGDFIWIVHTRNLGIAFSIGDEASALLRTALFIVLPALFLVGAVIYGLRSAKLTNLQRFAIAFVVGGGFGNLIDRIFRPEGVVDFVSLSLFGIFGMDRFFTFNIADLSITCGAVLLVITGFLWEEPKPAKEDGNDQRS